MNGTLQMMSECLSTRDIVLIKAEVLTRESHDRHMRDGLFRVKHASCVTLCCHVSGSSHTLSH